jgi:phage gp46-like protein
MRSKATPTLLALVKNDIETALQWLIDDGVAAAIDVLTEFTRPNMLGAQVTIHRNSAPAFALRFARLWDAV